MEKISWVIVEWSRCFHVALHPNEERKTEQISLLLQSNGSVSFNFDLECRLLFHLISMGICMRNKLQNMKTDHTENSKTILG